VQSVNLGYPKQAIGLPMLSFSVCLINVDPDYGSAHTRLKVSPRSEIYLEYSH
jgi:hypothetical protein